MPCESCHQNKSDTRSAVVNGIYYPSLCDTCLASSRKVNSGHARWSRTIDLEDAQFDLMQPFNADGSRNAKFIKAYPKQSAAIFTQKEMDDTLRT